MMIMMWGVDTKAQAPTPMPTYKHGLDMQGSNKYNTYRTDNTVANGTQVQTSDFTGEFQLFVNAINNHWIKVRELNSSYIEYFSYRIENVGYPFLPNCDNSDFNNRKFVIANSSTYSYPRYQISGLTNVTHVFNEINREIENQYPNSNSFNVAQPIYKNGELVKHVQLNRPMTLVSDFYKSGFNANLPLNRYYLPQGIFKITYYLEAGCENEVYADSVSFMVDCTRGNYNKYPFYPINFNNEAKAVYHDLSFFGYLGMPPNYNQSSNSFNTLNYVIPSSVYTGKQACNEIYTNPNLGTPTGYNSNYELPIFNNTTSYILSADYSLNLFENRSGVGAGTYAGYRDNNGTQTLSPGIPHTYTIDSPFDITQINPDEKVFYNPSVVSITSPYLVFPAGYTFKTVRGLYPTATQVYTEQAAQQANTGNAYRTSFTYDDSRHVYIPTDLAKSIYNVESGATLYIQPCVTIWDATINVKAGAKLVYDPTKTYGNYTIVNQGGTIVATTYDEEVCTECNYPNKYNYLNHNVTANYTYTAGIHRIRDYVQVNAGATLTIPANCNLQMGPNSYIVVKPGGKLYLQGKISGRCGMQWQGIIVEGNPTQAQTYSSTTGRYINQGYVISNGGKILNAHTAISIGNADGTMGGGVAVLDYAIFRNNHTGVKLQSSNTNNSLNNCAVRGCNFDNQYPVKNGVAYQALRTHIMLKDIKTFAVTAGGGNIANNIFNSNISNNWADNTTKGTGVLSYNSNVALDNNNFGTLLYGVDIYNTATLLNTFIKNNRFSYTPTGSATRYTTHGIKIEGGAYANINTNTFTIPESGTGINIIGHTNYLITENTFINAGSTTNRAIVSSNSGSATAGTAEIYKNTINGIKQNAVETQNQNQKLKIDCNAFVANKIDISVTSGTLANQGSCTPILGLPAANTFTTPCGAPTIMSILKEATVTNFQYNAYNGRTPDPACISIGITSNNCGINVNSSTVCPTKLNTSNTSGSRIGNNAKLITDGEETINANAQIRSLLADNKLQEANDLLRRGNIEYANILLLKNEYANNESNNIQLYYNTLNADNRAYWQAIANTLPAQAQAQMRNRPTEAWHTDYNPKNENEHYLRTMFANVHQIQIPIAETERVNVNRELNNKNDVTNKLNTEITISVFPNPTNTAFNMNTFGNKYTVNVLNSVGQVLETGTFIGEKSIGYDYPLGLYYLQIKNEQGVQKIIKLIKQ